MKIGIFLDDIDPKVGGGYTFQNDIFQALLKSKSNHTLVVFSRPTKKQVKEITAEHINIVPLPHNISGWTISWINKVVRGTIASIPVLQNRFYVAHWFQRLLHQMEVEVLWFVTPQFIEVDVPYIYTVWDLQHRFQPWFPEVSAGGEWHRREKIYRAAISRALAVIVGTKTGKAEVVNFYQIPSERVKLIPHPTPIFALNPPKENGEEVLKKYHLSPKGYLFYPAQFWFHKNHVGLLAAVKLLRQKYGIVLTVVFVGSDQGNLSYIRSVVNEFRLSTQVYFLGFVSQEELVVLYRNAFALTYVTFFGPENLPPLEAFALGCPVIASRVAGAEEQLGDAALFVDPKDEEQIALTIKSLCDDPVLRQTLIQRGKERASKWTAEDYVKRVLTILDEFEPIRRCW